MLEPCELHRPATVEQACQLLQDLGSAAHVYAGGTELLLVLNQGLAESGPLVDIKRIARLRQISWDSSASELSLGATLTHHDIERSQAVIEHCASLAELEHEVANVRVRNTGTLGGNLCFAEPHGDPGILLLALDARVLIQGTSGTRELPLDEFYRGLMEVDLRPTEILTDVKVPVPARGSGVAYVRFAHLERPTVGVAAVIGRSARGTLTHVRIAVGCVGPRPTRVRPAEAWLEGQNGEGRHALLREAGRIAAASLEVSSDQYGPQDYKTHLVGTMVERALERALHRTKAA